MMQTSRQETLSPASPSPFAALGLAGAIARKAKLNGWNAKAVPIFHKIDISAGRLRASPEADGSRIKPIEVVETVTGQIEFSLILEFIGDVSATLVAKHLARARFSGGSLFPLGNRRLIDCVHELQDDDLSRTLRSLPRGYALTPPLAERDDCKQVSFGEYDSLRDVISAAYPGDRTKGSGMRVPCPVGYRTCEDPATASPRKGGRSPDIPHVFVDQALGVAEMISIRNRTHFGSANHLFEHLAWRWRQDPTARFAFFSSFHFEAAGLTTNTIAS